jgi:hypothetical protein
MDYEKLVNATHPKKCHSDDVRGLARLLRSAAREVIGGDL